MRFISGRRTRKGLPAAVLVSLAALSAACSTTTPDSREFDLRERHAIMISEEPEILDLRVGMNGPALSPEIEAAVRDYVRGYRSDGTGNITIQVPIGSANEVAAGKTGRAVHYALARAGVPQGRISVAPYHVGDHSKAATLRLSYLRVKAVTPRCGVWPETEPNDFRNTALHNHGCASQQNLAAMVAKPADLVRPQPMGPADGNRRADVIGKYRVGEDPKSGIELIDSDIGD